MSQRHPGLRVAGVSSCRTPYLPSQQPVGKANGCIWYKETDYADGEQADKLGRQVCSVEKEQVTAKGLFPLKQEDKPEQPLRCKMKLIGLGGYFSFFVRCGLTCFVALGDPCRIFRSLWLRLCSRALVGSGNVVMVTAPALTETSTHILRAHICPLAFKSLRTFHGISLLLCTKISSPEFL